VIAAAGAERSGLLPALAATRARLGLVVLLVGLAAAAWWWTSDRMRGMDDGPGTDLGSLGWFLGVWVVMMAAMMLPSVSPTVALYSHLTRSREPLAPLVFTAGYLLVWGAIGLLAYGISASADALIASHVSWDGAGRWVTAAIVAAAALYELTPPKDACLGRCRSPLGFLVGSWRDGLAGALRMGATSGAWCAGCCWALMAALFALGVMSIAWMALVAALVAGEKMLPWGRAATWGTAALLLALGVLLVAVPDAIPGLTIPGSSPPTGRMDQMDGG
jgi:predicted metal-binding membrane protein